jgi:hypothetical protein
MHAYALISSLGLPSFIDLKDLIEAFTLLIVGTLSSSVIWFKNAWLLFICLVIPAKFEQLLITSI